MNFEEISKHNKQNDLYVVIHNKVYNITAFLNEVKQSSLLLLLLSFKLSCLLLLLLTWYTYIYIYIAPWW